MNTIIRMGLICLFSWGSIAHAIAATEKTVDIGGGVVLHYVEQGRGPTVIFAHGSLSSYSYWEDQIEPFSQHYHVIAYSRRYNPPNDNAAQPGYSAVTDSDDLAAMIKKLNLGKVYVVGHSYGAFAALFLAARHPDLLRAAVLAEPPAMSLLLDMPPDQAAEGKRQYADAQLHMVKPMTEAFVGGRTEDGVRTFINYVFGDPLAWDHMTPASRAETLRAAHEWEVMLPKGTLFPAIAPEAVKAINVPVLLMSGDKSYPFLGLITTCLQALLPNARSVVFSGAGHQMWLQQPDRARTAVTDFLAAHP